MQMSSCGDCRSVLINQNSTPMATHCGSTSASKQTDKHLERTRISPPVKRNQTL